MSIGTVLVGVAFFVVLVAYVGRPFRPATGGVDPENAIESWVARVREEDELKPGAVERASLGSSEDAINYCRECGRRVSADDRFCSGCGTRLHGGEA
jgi:hypothetical protein